MLRSDIKILRKNQPKILKNVLIGYNFSPTEVNQINNNYLKAKVKYTNIKEYLRRLGGSERECLLADIYESTEIENLIKVNDFIDLKIKNPDEGLKKTLNILGISIR